MYTLNIPVGLERRELKRRKENQFGIMISNCKKRKGERERKKTLRGMKFPAKNKTTGRRELKNITFSGKNKNKKREKA